jgi:hypothetical protein
MIYNLFQNSFESSKNKIKKGKLLSPSLVGWPSSLSLLSMAEVA